MGFGRRGAELLDVMDQIEQIRIAAPLLSILMLLLIHFASERPVECTDFFSEKLGFFHGGKMAAPRHYRPARDI